MTTNSSFLIHITDKLFRDKQGRVVLLQPPNPALLLWAAATIASHLLPANWRAISSFVALVAIIIWSVMEIYAGSSMFRRVLGVTVLLVLLLSRL